LTRELIYSNIDYISVRYISASCRIKMDKRIYKPVPSRLTPKKVKKQSVEALNQAIQIVGGITKLAYLIGTSRQLINRFRKEAIWGVSAQFCIPIEKATGGLVDRYHLRPDLFDRKRQT